MRFVAGPLTLSGYPEVNGIHRLKVRLQAQWQLKLVGIPCFMALFFTSYFFVLRHPVFPVTVMPRTVLDELIPAWPNALSLYVSLWIFVLLPPALIFERRELIRYAVGCGLLGLVGLTLFFLWPTSVPPSDFPPGTGWAFAYLKRIDATGNACPSLHVAFAVFAACWLVSLLKELGAHTWVALFCWIWCIGILYSTVATRQHLVLDVGAGAGLGAVVVLAVPRVRRGQRSNEVIMASG